MDKLRTTALTLLIGVLGAAVAWGIHMPLAFLGGSAIAVAIAGLNGMQVDIAPRLRDFGFLVVGLTIGSLVTPESLAAMGRWPIAFALLAALTVATPYAGRWLLSRHMGFDRNEAYLSAAPGHLSLVVALADSLKLSVTRPAILASIRVLSLTLVVPLAARLAGLEIGPGLPGRDTPPTGWLEIGVQMLAALALVPVLKRLRIPAPTLIAAMLVGGATHLGGIVEGALPRWTSQVFLVLMGALIGTRFAGTSGRALLHSMGAGVAVVVLTTGLALLFALPASWLSGLPLLDILVGFAPGGLETMVIVGTAIGADPTFVATAHVLRLLVLALILTGYTTRMARRASSKPMDSRR